MEFKHSEKQRRVWVLKNRRERGTVRGRLFHLLRNARVRAKKAGLPVEIDIEYLLSLWETQGGCCPHTGIPFDLRLVPGGTGTKSPWAPSIDRIDPSKGYTEDNVQLICVIYNLAKSNWTDDVVREFIEAYMERN